MILPYSISEVIEHLDQIISWSVKNENRLGYFPSLYRKVTIKVQEKISDNYFEDNERMEKLDVIFANRYLKAFYKYQNEEQCSSSWALCFERTKFWSPLVLQHLLLGMNAHISLDLGIAASRVSNGKDVELLKVDFLKINEILASLVDEIQDQLSGMWPLLKPIDWIAGKLDESIARFGMDIARDAAWHVALDYSQIENTADREKYIKERDLKVEKFGSKLATPGLLLSNIIRVFKLLEIGSIEKKIKLLS
jgi:hypothetical protein